jgi:hypothetical protein
LLHLGAARAALAAHAAAAAAAYQQMKMDNGPKTN